MAVTYHLAQRQASLFIDGPLDVTQSDIPPMGTTTSDLRSDSAGGAYWLHGAIDDVRIHRRALSAEENPRFEPAVASGFLERETRFEAVSQVAVLNSSGQLCAAGCQRSSSK